MFPGSALLRQPGVWLHVTGLPLSWHVGKSRGMTRRPAVHGRHPVLVLRMVGYVLLFHAFFCSRLTAQVGFPLRQDSPTFGLSTLAQAAPGAQPSSAETAAFPLDTTPERVNPGAEGFRAVAESSAFALDTTPHVGEQTVTVRLVAVSPTFPLNTEPATDSGTDGFPLTAQSPAFPLDTTPARANLGAEGFRAVAESSSFVLDTRRTGVDAESTRSVAESSGFALDTRPIDPPKVEGFPISAISQAFALNTSDGLLGVPFRILTRASDEDGTAAQGQVRFSPDGLRVAATQNSKVRLWDLRSTRPPTTIQADAMAASSLDFAPAGDQLITANVDGWLHWYDTATHTPVGGLAVGGLPPKVVFSPDGSHVLASVGGAVTMFPRPSMAPPIQFPAIDGEITCAAISPDNRFVIAGSSLRVAFVWEVESQRLVGTLGHHSHALTSVGFSPDGREVLTASLDGTVRIWGLNDLGELLALDQGTPVVAASWSTDGRFIVSANSSTPGRAFLWNAHDGSFRRAFSDLSVDATRITDVALSPDQTVVATSHSDGQVRVWDSGLPLPPTILPTVLDVGRPVATTLRSYGKAFYQIAFSAGRGMVVHVDLGTRRAGLQAAPGGSTASSRSNAPRFGNLDRKDAPDGAGVSSLTKIRDFDVTALQLFAAQGRMPSVHDFDTVTQAKAGDLSIEVPLASVSGDPYFLLLTSPYLSGGELPIRIDVQRSEFHLSAISPSTAGNQGSVTVEVQGTGLTADTVAKLVGSGGVERIGRLLLNPDTTRQYITFDLRGLGTDGYTVQIDRPGQGSVSLPNAFAVTSGLGPRLQANLLVPQAMRPGRDYVLTIDYANVGDADMAAPIFVLTAGTPGIDPNFTIIEGRPVHVVDATLPPAQKVAELQVLGLNQAGPPGVIPPGGHFTIPVQYTGPNGTPHQQLDFKLQVLRADDTPVDWNDLATKLRPPNLDPALWAAILANFQATVGNTWADYLRVLDAQANLLAQAGSPTLDHGQLLAAAIGRVAGTHLRRTLAASLDASAPTPGIPLAFSRVALSGLEQRYTVGPLGRGWSHNFDFKLSLPNSNTVHIAGPGGGVRVFTKDSAGSWNPSAGDFATLTEPADSYVLREKTGVVWRFGADGRPASVEDPNQNRITLGYTGGFLTSLAHSSGISLALEYNATGRLVKLTGNGGQSTEYHYDATGELLTEVIAPGNTITRYDYANAPGQPSDRALAAISFPDDTHQFYAYDALGRLAEQSRDGGAERLRFAYDAVGNVSVTDASGKITTLQLSDTGQPLAVRDALGRTTSFQYDASLNLTRITDPDGGVSTLDYDAQGNATRFINPLGQTVGLKYNGLARLDSLTDAKGQFTAFGYDSGGNLTGITYPDSSMEAFAHDVKGEATTLRNRRGQSITLTRNAFGQITRKSYPGGRTTDFSYDDRGNLTNVTDSTQGVTSMRYDDRGLLTRITYPDGKGFGFDYNGAGRRTSRTGHDGYVLRYGYDEAGRLAKLTDGNGKEIIRYGYDTTGRLSREDKGNGTWTSYHYDDAGQLLELVNCAKDGSVISRFAYTYDANGNRTSITTLAGRTEYGYDRIGQLTSVTFPDGRVVTYAYDAAGNRVTVTDNGTATAYYANNLNEYTQVGAATFAYDADGNMTSKQDAGGTTTYDYDLENRLVRVVTPNDGTWDYTYDALGNRVAVAHDGQTTRYLNDPVGLVDVAAEYNGAGMLVARYDHGLGLAARVDGAGAAAFYDFDALGHTRELTDAGGGVANHYDYDPFGVPLLVREVIANPFQYVGRFGVMSEGNGLQFMRARFFTGDLGAFLSEDPIGYDGGGTNLRLYVGNSPALFVDPSGLRTRVTIYVWRGGGVGHSAIEVGGEYLSKYPSVDVGPLSGSVPSHYANKSEEAVQPSRTVPFDVTDAAGARMRQEILNLKNRGADFELLTCNCVDDVQRVLEAGGFPHKSLFTPEQLDKALPDYINLANKQILDEERSQVVLPHDPNDKIAPAGVGPTHALAVADRLEYMIRFENDPKTATAPVQELVVVDYLDANLDWTSVRFGTLSYGDRLITIQPEAVDFSVRDLPPTNSISITGKTKGAMAVDVSASLNPQTGRLEWRARAIDTKTGLLPEDALAGFLPQANGAGRNGYVTFSVKPKVTTPLGTVITNIASIVFDSNDPIPTPPVWNTIADVAPKLAFSIAYAAAEIQPGNPFTYTLTITNGGSVDIAGITISNSLPVGLSFGSTTSTSGTADFSNGTVAWTVGTLAPGGSASLSVTATPGSEGEFDLGFVAIANGGSITINQPTRIVVGSPTKPSLAVSLNAGLIELTWPSSSSGYQLQATATLGLPNAWQPVAANPVAVGGFWKVTLGASQTTQYFRLAHP